MAEESRESDKKKKRVFLERTVTILIDVYIYTQAQVEKQERRIKQGGKDVFLERIVSRGISVQIATRVYKKVET